jgi:hypothetical protein
MMRRIAGGLLVLVASCGGIDPGSSPDGGGEAADLSSAPQPKFSSLFGSYLNQCGSCHAPGAPGRTSDIEQTLDFSTVQTAYTTLTTGKALGLTGNQQSCNMTPFIVSGKPAQSLLVATLDGPTRVAFDLPASPSCDSSAISDETVKVGSAPSAEFVVALKEWITGNAPND